MCQCFLEYSGFRKNFAISPVESSQQIPLNPPFLKGDYFTSLLKLPLIFPPLMKEALDLSALYERGS